ncbi:hypothetical protein [Sulfurimonas sp.]|uniref:hypothetical protein n=1 Tax=Sulfurimonas sp. TaxID=2022749 RepID=UPI00286D8CDC|nr:hypothetical protein [Sulfurimonas sp.]
MKKNLGRVVLAILFFLHIDIFASTYIWSATSNKTTAYVNEPIYLKYICEFSDSAELSTIDFNIAGDYEKYRVKNLRENQTIVDGKKINSYEFVAYAKKAGEIRFDFEAIMKQTNKESVENMVIGRDNMKKGEFATKTVKQKILTAEIKETNSTLVGEFSIDIKKNVPRVKAYEPYHMQIIIKGSGNFEDLKPLSFNIEGVKVFAGEVEQKHELNENGESGEWSQKFAFVSEKDFKIPEVKIEYFNLREQKTESLVLEAVDVSVEKGFAKEELLDKVDDKSFKFNYNYLYGILMFIAGFLAAKINIKKQIPKQSVDEEFKEKIKSAKSLDELMIFLVLEDSKKYEQIILDIEAKKITVLKNAKEAIFK